MRVWITKYALTTGVFEVADAELFANDSAVTWKSKEGYSQYAHGKDWHRTREDAFTRAEEMRVKKIAALEASIKRLRALTFT
jgi:hypothetical protein